MSTQRYSVIPHPIETLLTWVKSGKIAIDNKPPEKYFNELAEQVNGGQKKKYGGITEEADLRANLRASCIPEAMLDGQIPNTTTSSRSAAS